MATQRETLRGLHPVSDETRRAVISAYAHGVPVYDIVSLYGVSRQMFTAIVLDANVKRGVDPEPPTPRDVANLYAMLIAAQRRIEALQAEVDRLRSTSEDE